jgi:transposase-like protein
MALDEGAMADLLAALRAGGGLDVVREALALVLQALIDAEATEVIGVRPDERTQARTTIAMAPEHGCYRPRPAMSSAHPKLCVGSLFPALLEPRRRIDRALVAVVMQAYVHGTSTRKVDDLVKPWASTAASPSPRSAGSAPRWMVRSRRSGAGRWPHRLPLRLVDATTSRPASMGGWCRGRW